MKFMEFISMDKFNKIMIDSYPEFTTDDIQKVMQLIEKSIHFYPKSTHITSLSAELLVNKQARIYKIIHQNGVMTKNSLTNNQQVHNNFSWTRAYDLELKQAEEFSLVKGVAMSEGTTKRGEVMTEDNLRFAAGAMAASALLGFAVLDIDHYENKLPTQKESGGEKYEKYDVDKINELYPAGYIIDSELVKNKVGIQQKDTWQVEFIGVIENQYVKSMINQGLIKACSVVDVARDYSCDNCNSEGECTCDVSGSKFMYNTLVLEEIPNSNSTWISLVNKNDIGTILKPFANSYNLKNLIQNRIKLNKLNKPSSINHKLEPSNLERYRTDDGKWIDINAVKEFLINEKNIPEQLVEEMAEHIFNNPHLLNDDQLEYLSGDDLVSWFSSLNNKPNSEAHATQLTKADAGYTSEDVPEENQCKNCRWFTGTDEEIGKCQLVEGDILVTDTCNRFEDISIDADADAGIPADDADADDTDKISQTTNKLKSKIINHTTSNKPVQKVVLPSISLNNNFPNTQITDFVEQLDELKTKQNDIGMICGSGRMKLQTEYEMLQAKIYKITQLQKTLS